MDEINSEKIANLFIEFSKVDTFDYQSARKYLEDKEIDVDSFVSSGLQRIKKLEVKQKMEAAKKRKKLYNKAQNLLTQLKEDTNTQNIKDAVLKFFGRNQNPEMQLFFNNIQELEEEDAELMLDNAKLLDIIDKLEDAKKDNNRTD